MHRTCTAQFFFFNPSSIMSSRDTNPCQSWWKMHIDLQIHLILKSAYWKDSSWATHIIKNKEALWKTEFLVGGIIDQIWTLPIWPMMSRGTPSDFIEKWWSCPYFVINVTGYVLPLCLNLAAGLGNCHWLWESNGIWGVSCFFYKELVFYLRFTPYTFTWRNQYQVAQLFLKETSRFQ